jgi:hypothetical protein
MKFLTHFIPLDSLNFQHNDNNTGMEMYMQIKVNTNLQRVKSSGTRVSEFKANSSLNKGGSFQIPMLCVRATTSVV